MKLYQFLSLAFLTFLIAACDPIVNEPLVGGFGTPGQVRNIRVENLPGAAKIYYTLPYDRGLSYVQAEYTNSLGERVAVNSSAFKNYLLIEGFGEQREYEVELYSISKSDDRSAPVKVKINPTTPPVQLSWETLDVMRTFGGVQLKYENMFEAEFVLYTLVKDEEGNWTEYDRMYTEGGTANIQHSVRGLAPNPTDFAFYLRDKWHNISDTMFTNITPLYEEELDKSLWKDAALMDDGNVPPRYSPLYQLWTPGATTYFFQDNRGADWRGLPTWVTIDFGKPYILGRMKSHQVNHSATWQYGSCSPRLFEIWGSNEATTDWDKWTLLGDFEVVKPSGLPLGTNSADDLALATAGHDFEFELTENSYRYIRYKVKETWGRLNYFCLLELTFWGQAVN